MDKIEPVERSVKVELDNVRRAQIGLEIADLAAKLLIVLGEREDFLVPSKSIEKQLDQEIDRLSQVVRQGHEYRAMRLLPQPDFKAGVMLYVDPATGVEVDRRPLFPEERQTTIPT